MNSGYLIIGHSLKMKNRVQIKNEEFLPKLTQFRRSSMFKNRFDRPLYSIKKLKLHSSYGSGFVCDEFEFKNNYSSLSQWMGSLLHVCLHHQIQQYHRMSLFIYGCSYTSQSQRQHWHIDLFRVSRYLKNFHSFRLLNEDFNFSFFDYDFSCSFKFKDRLVQMIEATDDTVFFLN